MKEGVTFISQKKAYSEEIFSVLDETEIDYVNNAMDDTDKELIASDDISYHLATNKCICILVPAANVHLSSPIANKHAKGKISQEVWKGKKNRTNKKKSMSFFTK